MSDSLERTLSFRKRCAGTDVNEVSSFIKNALADNNSPQVPQGTTVISRKRGTTGSGSSLKKKRKLGVLY